LLVSTSSHQVLAVTDGAPAARAAPLTRKSESLAEFQPWSKAQPAESGARRVHVRGERWPMGQ